MKKLAEEVGVFYKSKIYVIVLAIIGICSYGFAIAHPAIGIDDTAISLYFEDGLAPYIGRWTLYIINKIFRINDFAPWMVEFISIVLFMLSVTLWCVLFRRVCGKNSCIPVWSYLFVAGIFISCPLISEVYVYYLHNGICIGYGIIALALLVLLESFEQTIPGKKKGNCVILSMVFLTIATGCYESFMIVYALGAVMLYFLLRRFCGKEKQSEYSTALLPWIAKCGFVAVGSLLLRAVIIAFMKSWLNLERFESLSGAFYRGLLTSISMDMAEIVMIIKRYWMKYFVNGFAYLPIAVLVFAYLVIGLCSMYYGWKKRDIMLPVCTVALGGIPIAMCIIEGITTRYRTAQFVPVLGAFGVLLVLCEIYERGLSRWVKGICCFLFSVLLFNQCVDINRWFYLDYKKYENAKETMKQVAEDLERTCDTTKPLVFVGVYRVPYEIKKAAYCTYESKEYQWIARVSDMVDPHLKEKYFAEDGMGYVFAETPTLSTLEWAAIAFDGSSKQLIEFLKMHGYSYQYVKDIEKIEEMQNVAAKNQMPGYPKEGYIREFEDCILINLDYNG